jgi:hypothetical protein
MYRLIRGLELTFVLHRKPAIYSGSLSKKARILKASISGWDNEQSASTLISSIHNQAVTGR